MIYLRPHHINCIFFYKGLGYSEDFVNKMDSIQNLLKEYPETEVKLIKKCDEICKACPNMKCKGICTTEEKVLNLDENTLDKYNLHDNKNYMFKELISKIYMNFDENKFYNICKECGWYKQGVCNKNIIKQHRDKWVRK